jgi:hypothetical protein
MTPDPDTRRRRRRSSLLALATTAAVSVVAACATPGLTPPARPATGPGSRGPCTSTASSFPNPAVAGLTIHLYHPGGAAPAPTGGTCDDGSRPVAVVVHGLMAMSPVLYQGIIDHLVATGNIVVFAVYNTNPSDFLGSFRQEADGIAAGVARLTRGDTTRLGLIGHSMGGGAVPYLVQQLDGRGWGAAGFWVMSLAPWVVAGVPEGPIAMPANARFVVQNYEAEALVSNADGAELYRRLALPADRKQYVLLHNHTHRGTTVNATHVTPNSGIAPENVMRFYGIYRIADLLQACAHAGRDCDADLGHMGQWSDGTPFRRATSTDEP